MTENDARRDRVNARPPATSSSRAATLRGPWGLSDSDAARVEDEYGVSSEQVDRDHAISHVLAALSSSDLRDHLVFFGGTALTRTFLPRFRLREDIDLLTELPRTQTAP